VTMSSVSSTEESRSRSSSVIKLDAEISLSSDSHFFAGIAGDVARGGIFVATYRRFPVGAVADLELSMPDGPLTARGVVCWVRDPSEGVLGGIGLRITELAASDRARIERFCNFRSPLYCDVDE